MVTWSIHYSRLVYIETGRVVQIVRVDELTERLERPQCAPYRFGCDRGEYVRIMLNNFDRVALVVV